jgi:hypothetical protein
MRKINEILECLHSSVGSKTTLSTETIRYNVVVGSAHPALRERIRTDRQLWICSVRHPSLGNCPFDASLLNVEISIVTRVTVVVARVEKKQRSLVSQ